jgi:hypothetical protein
VILGEIPMPLRRLEHGSKHYGAYKVTDDFSSEIRCRENKIELQIRVFKRPEKARNRFGSTAS